MLFSAQVFIMDTPVDCINIAIADDHVIFLEGLSATLSAHQDCNVMIKAGSGEQLLGMLHSAAVLPHLCIFDISLSITNGYETLKLIKKQWPQIKVLIISVYANELNVIRSIKIGANGFLLKSSGPADIINAIRSICQKGYDYSAFIPEQHLTDKRESLLLKLNYQEMEFLSLCCSEMTYKAIADCMGVSLNTTEGYRKSLFEKLSVNSRIGLVLFALNMGMAPIYKQ